MEGGRARHSYEEKQAIKGYKDKYYEELAASCFLLSCPVHLAFLGFFLSAFSPFLNCFYSLFHQEINHC
jgi:hypothetical protein